MNQTWISVVEVRTKGCASTTGCEVVTNGVSLTTIVTTTGTGIAFERQNFTLNRRATDVKLNLQIVAVVKHGVEAELCQLCRSLFVVVTNNNTLSICRAACHQAVSIRSTGGYRTLTPCKWNFDSAEDFLVREVNVQHISRHAQAIAWLHLNNQHG